MVTTSYSEGKQKGMIMAQCKSINKNKLQWDAVDASRCTAYVPLSQEGDGRKVRVTLASDRRKWIGSSLRPRRLAQICRDSIQGFLWYHIHKNGKGVEGPSPES